MGERGSGYTLCDIGTHFSVSKMKVNDVSIFEDNEK